MVGREEVELVETALLKGGAALKPTTKAEVAIWAVSGGGRQQTRHFVIATTPRFEAGKGRSPRCRLERRVEATRRESKIRGGLSRAIRQSF
jgi:hypothetical protein